MADSGTRSGLRSTSRNRLLDRVFLRVSEFARRKKTGQLTGFSMVPRPF